MGRVVLSMFITLDGFISGPKGELDWLPQSQDTSGDVIETLGSADGILLGRETYTLFESYWPSAAADPSTYLPDVPLAGRLTEIPKYVFSARLNKVRWRNVTVIRDRAESAVAKLKRERAGDLVILGGATLAQSLMEAGLIDEYRLSVAPITLGKGIPLFKDLGLRTAFKLLEAKIMNPGFVKLCYRSTN